MRIEELWKALESDADAGKLGAGGWLLRLARPKAGCPLFVGVALPSRRRAMLLQLPDTSMPPRRLWPRCKGLEALAIQMKGNTFFGVALKETRHCDVFTALSEDLARRMSEVDTPAEQVSSFLGQLTRWQKFLSASLEGLSEEVQRGLWGELHFLREHLIPAFGTGAVAGWKGPMQAHQDFQFENGAIEVKTTLAKQPQVVRITSERQLDDNNWPALFLYVLALDVRQDGGETLVSMVATLRKSLAGDAVAQEQFEDALLAVGYLDNHAELYADRGYVVRSQKAFSVKNGFPRLLEKNLPTGIGDVNYGLAVGACEPFNVNFETVVAAIKPVLIIDIGGKISV
ncbi:MAG: PD-(D/E)XK motif protein [Desulfuromonadaceae bacterium]